MINRIRKKFKHFLKKPNYDTDLILAPVKKTKKKKLEIKCPKGMKNRKNDCYMISVSIVVNKKTINS